jgi:uncharacterized protein YjbI with pentapeptide repeats
MRALSITKAAAALFLVAGLGACAGDVTRSADVTCTVAPGGDCSGATLTRVAINGRDVNRMTLANADLRAATLMSNNLEGANLAGADLNGATLSGARLVGANLSGANLTRANLMGADLRDATIDGADFDRTILSGATWPDGRLCAAGSIGRCVDKWEAPSLIDQLIGFPGL